MVTRDHMHGPGRGECRAACHGCAPATPPAPGHPHCGPAGLGRRAPTGVCVGGPEMEGRARCRFPLLQTPWAGPRAARGLHEDASVSERDPELPKRSPPPPRAAAARPVCRDLRETTGTGRAVLKAQKGGQNASCGGASLQGCGSEGRGSPQPRAESGRLSEPGHGRVWSGRLSSCSAAP